MADKMFMQQILNDGGDNTDSIRSLVTTAGFTVAAQTFKNSDGVLTIILLSGLGDQETHESASLFLVADKDALIMLKDAIENQLEGYEEPSWVDHELLRRAKGERR